MSEAILAEPERPPQADITPPVDALATVAVSGKPITTLPVESDESLVVYSVAREQGDGHEWPEYGEIPDAPNPDDSIPAEVHAETRVSGPAWLVVFVGGDRRAQVSVPNGTERVTIHAEQADAENEVEP